MVPFRRLALVLGISSVWSATGCKQRAPGTSDVKADSDVGPASETNEARLVQAACDKVPETFFRGVDDGVAYVTEPGVPTKGETGRSPAYEHATFAGDRWLLSAAFSGRSGAAECIQTARVMTTGQFLAALGCTDQENACPQPDGFCYGSECPTTMAQTDTKIPRVPTSPDRLDASMALADEGTAVACEGEQLVTAQGVKLGRPVDTAEQCEDLKNTAHEGHVCAWTGRAFVAARVVDGKLVGNSDGGGLTIADCSRMIASGSRDVVCSWTGKGFTPFATSGTAPRPVGADEQSPVLEVCLDKTLTAKDGRMCAWDGKAIAIFEISSQKAMDGLWGFRDLESCGRLLPLTFDPASLDAVKSAIRNADDAPPATGGSEGLRLAGDDAGWTWEECNEPQRAYHLTAQQGGQLVCQGKIDTLYSWGPEAKIADLKGMNWTGPLQRGGKAAPLFLTQSSFATFGYGVASIRVKLKPTSKLRFFPSVTAYAACSQLSAQEVEDTVIVRYLTPAPYTGVEFILCGLGPVHSWSYGTLEHANEMKREADWIASHDFKTYELYVKQGGRDTVYPNGLDSFRFDPATWLVRLAAHAREIPGQVFFNPSLPSSERVSAQHFKTIWPTYIVSSGDKALVTPKAMQPVVAVAAPRPTINSLRGTFITPLNSRVGILANGHFTLYIQPLNFEYRSDNGSMRVNYIDAYTVQFTHLNGIWQRFTVIDKDTLAMVQTNSNVPARVKRQ